MRIVGSGSSVTVAPRQFANETSDAAAADARSSALIAIEPPRQTERFPQSARHPSAPFVAHLLATRMQAPQTRARRRAEPEEAIALYRSMTKPVLEQRVFAARA